MALHKLVLCGIWWLKGAHRCQVLPYPNSRQGQEVSPQLEARASLSRLAPITRESQGEESRQYIPSSGTGSPNQTPTRPMGGRLSIAPIPCSTSFGETLSRDGWAGVS
eukprot:scaffold50171_cov31-Tisochrysis_lutea.AAC.2